MTPDRMSECLTLLHWSKRGFADIAKVQERQVRRWTNGERRIPDRVGEWLETIVRLFQAHPAPTRHDPWSV